jgi:hypothetical protein
MSANIQSVRLEGKKKKVGRHLPLCTRPGPTCGTVGGAGGNPALAVTAVGVGWGSLKEPGCFFNSGSVGSGSAESRGPSDARRPGLGPAAAYYAGY